MAYKNLKKLFPTFKIQREILDFSDLEAELKDFHGCFNSYNLKLKNGQHATIIVDKSNKEITMSDEELERILDLFPAPE